MKKINKQKHVFGPRKLSKSKSFSVRWKISWYDSICQKKINFCQKYYVNRTRVLFFYRSKIHKIRSSAQKSHEKSYKTFQRTIRIIDNHMAEDFFACQRSSENTTRFKFLCTHNNYLVTDLGTIVRRIKKFFGTIKDLPKWFDLTAKI